MRARRFRAAGRRGKDRRLTDAPATDRRSGAGWGDPGPDGREAHGAAGDPRERVPAGPQSPAPRTGRRWQERGPGPNKTPVRAPERLKIVSKCRPLERPHEPSTSRTVRPGGGIGMPIWHRLARARPETWAASGVRRHLIIGCQPEPVLGPAEGRSRGLA